MVFVLGYHSLLGDRMTLSWFGRQAEGEEGSTDGNIICLFLRIFLFLPASFSLPKQQMI